jgi:hypothetical protein
MRSLLEAEIGTLAVVGRSPSGAPRTYRRRQHHATAREAARDAAYRRLTAVLLRLDVATLAADLRAARLHREAIAPPTPNSALAA